MVFARSLVSTPGRQKRFSLFSVPEEPPSPLFRHATFCFFSWPRQLTPQGQVGRILAHESIRVTSEVRITRAPHCLFAWQSELPSFAACRGDVFNHFSRTAHLVCYGYSLTSPWPDRRLPLARTVGLLPLNQVSWCGPSLVDVFPHKRTTHYVPFSCPMAALRTPTEKDAPGWR